MNLMQRLYGLAWISIRERLHFRFDFFMTLISNLMFSALFYMVWRAIYTYSDVHVMSWQVLITYVMMGQAINFSRWSPADRAPVYSASTRIRTGDIALDLVRPIDFQLRRFTEAIGFFSVEMLWVNIPSFLLFIIVLGITPPKDIFSAIGFLISLLIAFIVSFGLNSIVMMISFWTTNAQGAQIAKKAILDILSGTLIPFDFFPAALKAVVVHLPFQGMAYIPLSIYTGKLTGMAMVQALFEQLGWAIVMLMISRLIWMQASKRITIYGG
ncbi:MAG: hypothetical protein JWN30_2182 [Bacilli bacterium]|nr:hypothetical protein [Bacilli bacterium]